MSKKHKHHHGAVSPTLDDIKERAERARRENRFQQALELVKQVYKADPSPAHLELLKETSLARARQLRGQNQTRDAANVLEGAARLDEGNPAWLERLASEMAQCGEAGRAQALLAKVPEEARSGAVTTALADAVVVQEGANRATLPPTLHADLDRVLLAFRQVEQGQDDAAREALQAVGLRSPFAEWKLLLRGLQAYYQKDDTRALDNWQRLSPDRPPARLAAPFRAQIDPAFKSAQSPPTQAALQQQLEGLQSPALLPQMRGLRSSMARRESLGQAFRQAEAFMPALRNEAPHLVPRLANSFYWAILESGPDDILRYKRVFGAPPTDPNFHRLRALAYDRHGQPAGSHEYWQLYEKDVASHPEMWPNGQAARARALIWKHLGDNAAGQPDEDELDPLSRMLGGLPNGPTKLKPPADKCYQRSLELAPDLLEAHSALVAHLFDEDQDDKAEKAARRLLERFPNHLPTLELLGAHLMHTKPEEALGFFQRAQKNNPLQRGLQVLVGEAHRSVARFHTLEGNFEEARQHFQSVLTSQGQASSVVVLPRWAACEFKAGDTTRAEELLQQARASCISSLMISYAMMMEASLLKLPSALKKRFDKEAGEALKAPPTASDASALAALLLIYWNEEADYHGLKTHVKKALAYIDKARGCSFQEADLEMLCDALIDMGGTERAINHFLHMGQRGFPDNPFFPYREATHLLDKDMSHNSFYRARYLFQEAQRLARARPKDDKIEAMLADIEEQLHELQDMSPENIFGRYFGAFDDYPDDDWDE